MHYWLPYSRTQSLIRICTGKLSSKPNFKDRISPFTGKQGIVLSKGSGVFGCLGQGHDLKDCKAYNALDYFYPDDPKAILAAMGHSAVIDSGQLFLFGRPFEINNLLRINRLTIVSSALARFVNKTSASPLFGAVLLDPKKIEMPEKVSKIRSIGGFNILLSESGNVYTFGTNRWESTAGDYKAPENPEQYATVPGFVIGNMTQVDIGFQHCLSCTVDGELYAWGNGERGQLGTGVFETVTKPKKVRIPHNEKVVQILAGYNFSAVRTSINNVYVWGKYMSTVQRKFKNNDRMVFEDQALPRRITLPNNRKIVEICASSVTLVMRAEDDTLWIIGIAEVDNNVHVNPIQVCNQIPNPLPPEPGQDPKIKRWGPDIVEPIILPKGARLVRGYTRISVIYPKADPNNPIPNQDIKVAPAYGEIEVFPNEANGEFHLDINPMYDIILTEGLAYFVPVEDLIFQNKSDLVNPAYVINPKGKYSIVEYSRGWKHSLIMIKED